jgi:hypothetical protein
LEQHRIASLEEARQTIEAWRVEDTTERPLRALGQQAPAAVEAAWQPRQEAPSQPIKWTNAGGRSPRRGLP